MSMALRASSSSAQTSMGYLGSGSAILGGGWAQAVSGGSLPGVSGLLAPASYGLCWGCDICDAERQPPPALLTQCMQHDGR
jgi:hypothetical protein